MNLSSAMQTLSAWSRDSLKAFSLDLSLTPQAKARLRPKKTRTQAAHYALETATANMTARLAAELEGSR